MNWTSYWNGMLDRAAETGFDGPVYSRLLDEMWTKFKPYAKLEKYSDPLGLNRTEDFDAVGMMAFHEAIVSFDSNRLSFEVYAGVRVKQAILSVLQPSRAQKRTAQLVPFDAEFVREAVDKLNFNFDPLLSIFYSEIVNGLPLRDRRIFEQWVRGYKLREIGRMFGLTGVRIGHVVRSVKARFESELKESEFVPSNCQAVSA